MERLTPQQLDLIGASRPKALEEVVEDDMGFNASAQQTEHGFRFDEVTSAMQKCIRRGWVEEAVYWALELNTRFHLYVWKRLIIIAQEDVGISDPAALQTFEVCRQHHLALQADKSMKDKPDALLPLINAVMVLARATKTRAASDVMVVWFDDPEFKFEIPDIAVDRHTQRGRKMGRGADHWYDTGRIVEPEDRSFNLWLERAEHAARTKHGQVRGEG